jgi:hypothetical protein
MRSSTGHLRSSEELHRRGTSSLPSRGESGIGVDMRMRTVDTLTRFIDGQRKDDARNLLAKVEAVSPIDSRLIANALGHYYEGQEWKLIGVL